MNTLNQCKKIDNDFVETCKSGICTCGNFVNSTCTGLTTGDNCIVSNGVGTCQCQQLQKSCAGEMSGEYCDKEANSGNGECKCTQSLPACSISNESCDSIQGVCKCGSRSSCEGLQTGAYCDSTSSTCKCSSTVDSCPSTSNNPICDSRTLTCTSKFRRLFQVSHLIQCKIY